MTASEAPRLAALILAGGQSRRMAGVKKSELRLGGEWLLERIMARVRPQVAEMLVNLNEPVIGPALTNYRIVADIQPDCPGPLTGLASAFGHWQGEAVPPEVILLVPCDGPFVPVDLAEKLLAALLAQDADVACARYEGEAQPTFSLWHHRCGDAVQRQLAAGEGGFKTLLKQLKTVYVDWPPLVVNPFFNINTPDDLQLAERLLEAAWP